MVTRHYDDAGDSPAWSTAPGGTTVATRNVSGPTGDLAAIITGSAISLQLANLHGDAVATITPGAQATSAVFESTEFGAPRASADIGTRKYGWLGAKTREADNPSGIVLMGVRLYNAKAARFLSVDPVPGGSDNPYDYAGQDPVNMFDLDGRWKCGRFGWACKTVGKGADWAAKSGAVALTGGKKWVESSWRVPRYGNTLKSWKRVPRAGAKWLGGIGAFASQIATDSWQGGMSWRRRAVRAGVAFGIAAGSVAFAAAVCSTGVGCLLLAGAGASYVGRKAVGRYGTRVVGRGF